MKISSWGRLSFLPHKPHYFSDSTVIEELLYKTNKGIAYGMGRSYGDVCLNPGARLWMTSGLDRFRSFDDNTGRLICESGVLLGDLQRQFTPHGWSLPVVPGTQQVTVGGAIANDVHGKNHSFCGSFGNHVLSIKLVRTDGTSIICSPLVEPETFAATIGGIGLTGIIIEAEIQLKKIENAWLDTELIPYESVQDLFDLSASSLSDWEFCVAWLDCFSKQGRGIFMRANWDKSGSGPCKFKKTNLNFTPPISILHRLSLKTFSSLYFYLSKRKAGKTLMPYTEFFFPLDRILAWNKLYGVRGFYQYQCQIPELDSFKAILSILGEIKKAKLGCFLSVVKWFGTYPSMGMMSFPSAGLTLSLDFPNKGIDSEYLFSRLDAIISNYQGRIYLAKDARMPPDLFVSGYPKLSEFLAYRDPGLSSAMSRRLIGD